jgi:hypothetical protein
MLNDFLEKIIGDAQKLEQKAQIYAVVASKVGNFFIIGLAVTFVIFGYYGGTNTLSGKAADIILILYGIQGFCIGSFWYSQKQLQEYAQSLNKFISTGKKLADKIKDTDESQVKYGKGKDEPNDWNRICSVTITDAKKSQFTTHVFTRPKKPLSYVLIRNLVKNVFEVV